MDFKKAQSADVSDTRLVHKTPTNSILPDKPASSPHMTR